jgi:hypothetical protein
MGKFENSSTQFSMEIKKRLKGQVIVQEEEQALKEARKEREGLVLWTDGSRKEDEWTGCAVVWKEDRWNKRRVHLGRQKEAFDAEMYAMSEAVKIAEEICRSKEVRRVTIFTDSQAKFPRIVGVCVRIWAGADGDDGDSDDGDGDGVGDGDHRTRST